MAWLVVAATALNFAAIPAALAAPQRISATLPLSVRLTDGHSFGATRIRLGWNDLVRIVGPSGHVTSVSAGKIAEIRDGVGEDLTRVVLDGHEVIGTEATSGSAGADTLHSIPISDFAADQATRPPRRPPLSGFLMQGAYMLRVGESKEFVDTGYGADVVDRAYLQAELGGMGRVGEKYGVGMSVFMGGNTDLTTLGVKARVRRMLGPNTSLDLAPGYVRTVPTNGDLPESKGLVAEVSLMSNGWICFTTQFQTVQMLDANGHRSTELWWYAGPKIGGWPGTVAALLAFLAVGISQSVD
ncbi:MAG TPA: hypothetical protein VFY90_00675 [Tepidiformaceae bacterium]|nr:hypothetical protein [Tepidiformaceae bacterium]